MRVRILTWRHAFLALAVACGCGWFASTAAAEFGPIELVSKSSKEQAEFAEQPALSADGNFVVFFGELGGHIGIFRKDLLTGALTLVAERHRGEEVLKAPSISGEGRYISFTTTQSLVSADTEAETEDVYVADLATSPPTYRLVSAVGPVGEEHHMSGRSSAAGQVALNADGSEVAFVNEGQIYVRKLAATEPTLITVKQGAAEPAPVLGGGAYQPAGAALSADGNVVAWVGAHLPQQVPLLPDEEEQIKGFDGQSAPYHEPLWREVPTAAAPNPPTRRIVGGGDPLAPGCAQNGTLSEPPCQGPFPGLDKGHAEFVYQNIGQGWGISLPQLSADGDTVAVTGSPEEFADLFVVNMTPGLTRVQALRQLTKWTNPNPGAKLLTEINEYQSYVGPIEGCAISADGDEVAFTTRREYFPGSPLITPLPAVPPIYPELYQIDVERRTIERVTPGPGTEISLPSGEGADAKGGAELPSYSADGRRLLFSDMSYNLVAGDANEKSDVFLVESTPPGPIEPSSISPPPSRISVIPSWRLSARASSRPNGAVRVIATVPGAGTLRASAKSPLGPRLRLRDVGQAQRSSPAGGVVRLELRLPRKLRYLAHHKGGLYTWLDLRFSGPGGAPLQQQFPARFRAHRAKSSKGKKKE